MQPIRNAGYIIIILVGVLLFGLLFAGLRALVTADNWLGPLAMGALAGVSVVCAAAAGGWYETTLDLHSLHQFWQNRVPLGVHKVFKPFLQVRTVGLLLKDHQERAQLNSWSSNYLCVAVIRQTGRGHLPGWQALAMWSTIFVELAGAASNFDDLLARREGPDVPPATVNARRERWLKSLLPTSSEYIRD